MDKVTIDLKPVNDTMRSKGLEPFPVETITIEPFDDAHLQESCRRIATILQEWAMKQSRL
jgi:hypothetical protein